MKETIPCTHFLRVLRLPFGRCRDIVCRTLCRRSLLSDVEALVLDPLAAVAVRVLEAEVVVVAELLGENVICRTC